MLPLFQKGLWHLHASFSSLRGENVFDYPHSPHFPIQWNLELSGFTGREYKGGIIRSICHSAVTLTNVLQAHSWFHYLEENVLASHIS